MSQEKLAAALGLTFQQVQKYEKGTNRISAGRLVLIAELLGCPAADLLGEQERGQDKGDVSTVNRMLLTGARGIGLAETFVALPTHLQIKVADLVADIASAAGVSGQQREAA